ncbi:MAG: 2Fe-2S ferredoxin [Deltaproteobacteria bacterium CG11_big_fil_rev_8_21_14_0_20_45_16]|nr:MAG: 2Fe-2S ferredoxin [Deltaproteobacteria bacterium CG11_big_fil_rev_8_21_14_0_20_45_16]
MPTITFSNFGEKFEVPAGSSILECALEHNLPLDHDCGGNCACTTCQVFVESGMDNICAMSDDEKSLLEANDKLTDGARLGCQSRIQKGDIVVRIPD